MQKILTHKVKEQKVSKYMVLTQLQVFKEMRTKPIMIQNFDNSILTIPRDGVRSTSVIETQNSIYHEGNELLSKYKISSGIESYTTISNKETSNIAQESILSERFKNVSGESEVVLKDIFPKNKKKAIKGFQTQRNGSNIEKV